MNAEAFHAGERALQTRAGSRAHMAEIGPRVIRSFMPDQHRQFFTQLPFLVLGGLDAQLQPWAGALAAPAGFVHAPDARHLRIDALPAPDDPLARIVAPGAPVGLLGIEPPTRRRNRMNGVIEAVDASGFMVEVQQSFGNCPRYIQARDALRVVKEDVAVPQWLDRLDEAARGLIGRADTFFIATAHPQASAADAASHGVDVSHRGGRTGFVRIDGDNLLTVPDFAGNQFFNTLGNLALHPRAGLLFIDFDSGELLHVAATAEIVWNGPELAAFEGAERLLRLRVDHALRRPHALPLRWGDAQPSPHLAGTGRWEATAATAR